MVASRIEGARLRKSVQEDAELGIMQIGAPAATVTLNANSPPIISLDPGVAAINVVMYTPVPASAAPMYIIINRAAATGTLVVKQADGSTTVATIAVGKVGLVVWDGTTTSTAVGWRGSSLP